MSALAFDFRIFDSVESASALDDRLRLWTTDIVSFGVNVFVAISVPPPQAYDEGL